MPDPNAQTPTGTQTGWEAEKQRLEAELSSLRGSVQGLSKFKQRAEAWDRLAQDPAAQGAIKYGPDGMPIGWDVTEEVKVPQYAPTVNPFADAGIDPNAAAQWIQAQTQQVISQQGYITNAQAKALADTAAAQAYQLADHRFTTHRAVDKLLSNPLYSELADPNSEWSKRTANYIQQLNAGKPGVGGSGWDMWEFQGPQVLQQASDITYAQMVREQAVTGASQQQAIQNQQAAGLSPGPTNVPITPNPADSFDKAAAAGDKAMWDHVGKLQDASFRAAGLLKD